MKFRLTIILAGLLLFYPWLVAADASGYELSHGRQVLLDHGLQIQSWAYPWPVVPLNPDVFSETNFNTIFLTHPDANVAASMAPAWGRCAIYDYEIGELVPSHKYLSAAEMQIEENLVGLCYGDELTTLFSDPNLIPKMAATFAEWNILYPNALAYTNHWGSFMTETQLRTFMQAARPDMLMFDTYPGDFGNTKELWYADMQKYRKVALEGYDGTGNSPLPYAQYLKLYKRESNGQRLVSESFIRVQQFASWAFGYTFNDGFRYGPARAEIDTDVMPQIFSGRGDDSVPTPVFNYVAETNRQSLNLGPALVRMVSTDIRMIRGRFNGVRNSSIPGVTSLTSWTSAQDGDPYLAGITPLGKNPDLPSVTNYSDVWVGHFQPLLESNPGNTFVDGQHFMIVNGRGASESEWWDSTSTTADSLGEWYRLTFDFTASDYNSLVRLSRDTGQVELVSLTSLGNSRYSHDLYLEGGTGDLFGYWNSSNPLPTISGPTSAVEVYFQDDFESHAVGADLVSLSPPIGKSYATSNIGKVFDSATSPDNIGGADNSQKFAGAGTLESPNAYQDRMQISAEAQAVSTGKVVKFSLDYYVASAEGGAGNGPSIMALNTADEWTGDNYGFSWGFTVNQDGTISQWAGDVTALAPTGLTARTDTWIPIEVIADYGAGTYTATVDGHTFTGIMLVHDFKRLEVAPNSYDVQYYFDNVQIEGPQVQLIPGDADLDGDVDGDDAAILAMNWLSASANWRMGDFNGDEKVDDRDAAILAANWQIGVVAEASVSEPTLASGLLVIGLAVLAVHFRKKSNRNINK